MPPYTKSGQSQGDTLSVTEEQKKDRLGEFLKVDVDQLNLKKTCHILPLNLWCYGFWFYKRKALQLGSLVILSFQGKIKCILESLAWITRHTWQDESLFRSV